MKNIVFSKLLLGSLTGLLLILFSFTTNRSSQQLSGTISISGAFALYPLAVKWGQEFKKANPNVQFEISAGGAGKGMSDALGGLVDLGAVSREINAQEVKKGAYPVAVAIDAVVPTVNANNPNIAEILRKGIKKEVFIGIFVTGTIKNWKQAGFAIAAPINVYTRSDASGAAEVWAKYLGNKKQEDLKGVGVYGDPGLLQAVKKDKAGIGFNNISYAYDVKTQKQLPGLAVIPIDKNGNGKLDADENFYNTLDEIKGAVATGKYPSPPARELYFVSKGKPTRPEVAAFLKWVLTNGQRYVAELDYVSLTPEKLKAELQKVQ